MFHSSGHSTEWLTVVPTHTKQHMIDKCAVYGWMRAWQANYAGYHVWTIKLLLIRGICNGLMTYGSYLHILGKRKLSKQLTHRSKKLHNHTTGKINKRLGQITCMFYLVQYTSGAMNSNFWMGPFFWENKTLSFLFYFKKMSYSLKFMSSNLEFAGAIGSPS